MVLNFLRNPYLYPTEPVGNPMSMSSHYKGIFKGSMAKASS